MKEVPKVYNPPPREEGNLEQKTLLPPLPFRLFVSTLVLSVFRARKRKWEFFPKACLTEIRPFHLDLHQPSPPRPHFFLYKKSEELIQVLCKLHLGYWFRGQGKWLRFQDPFGSPDLQCVSLSPASRVHLGKHAPFARWRGWGWRQQRHQLAEEWMLLPVTMEWSPSWGT